MSGDTAYRLSRVQAEGWNAARKIPAGDLASLDAAKTDALNPHETDPERARWLEGFKSAI